MTDRNHLARSRRVHAPGHDGRRVLARPPGRLGERLHRALKSTLGDDYDSMIAEGERATGQQLPEDLETLLGDGVSLSVDGKTVDDDSVQHALLRLGTD